MHPMLFNSVLVVHIVFGFSALSSAFVALASLKGKPRHRQFGTFFFYAMTGIFVTAIPLAAMKHNLFLFLINLFSYYLALTGWRYACHRDDLSRLFDWFVSGLMVAIGILMSGLGGWYYLNRYDHAMVLLVFGVIGLVLSISNIKLFYSRQAVGSHRIAQHLSGMIGATIATLTAFLVTNVHFIRPAIVLWLGPTLVFLPIIGRWRRQVMHGSIRFLDK